MRYLTPIKAIREKCKDCAGDSAHEVKLCEARKCPLWPFRFGLCPETFLRKRQNGTLQAGFRDSTVDPTEDT